MVVCNDSLCLECRDDGVVEPFRKIHDGVPERPRSVADDDNWSARRCQKLDGTTKIAVRGGDAGARDPSLDRTLRGVLQSGSLLYLVGKDDVSDISLDDGVLDGERHQFRRVR